MQKLTILQTLSRQFLKSSSQLQREDVLMDQFIRPYFFWNPFILNLQCLSCDLQHLSVSLLLPRSLYDLATWPGPQYFVPAVKNLFTDKGNKSKQRRFDDYFCQMLTYLYQRLHSHISSLNTKSIKSAAKKNIFSMIVHLLWVSFEKLCSKVLEMFFSNFYHCQLAVSSAEKTFSTYDPCLLQRQNENTSLLGNLVVTSQEAQSFVCAWYPLSSSS